MELFRRAIAPASSELEVPRTLTVFAHQDDESIALASRLSRFAGQEFLLATDGSPVSGDDARRCGVTPEDYRAMRAAELQQAFLVAGVTQPRVTCLDRKDQRLSLELTSLTESLQQKLAPNPPQVIFTHPYEGGHPDHDACAFAVQHAVLALPAGQRPVVIEAAFYHQGSTGIETACFLPGEASDAVAFHLTKAERQTRSRVLDCFQSQAETLAYFSREVEMYRIAPTYDFAQPPHPGKLFYENFDWGMTGERFRTLAAAATAALPAGQEEALCR